MYFKIESEMIPGNIWGGFAKGCILQWEGIRSLRFFCQRATSRLLRSSSRLKKYIFARKEKICVFITFFFLIEFDMSDTFDPTSLSQNMFSSIMFNILESALI